MKPRDVLEHKQLHRYARIGDFDWLIAVMTANSHSDRAALQLRLTIAAFILCLHLEIRFTASRLCSRDSVTVRRLRYLGLSKSIEDQVLSTP